MSSKKNTEPLGQQNLKPSKIGRPDLQQLHTVSVAEAEGSSRQTGWLGR